MYRLNDKLQFPHPRYANSEGLLAYGGDLSPERLILAYQNGIFPWYNEDEDSSILWWSPQERFVLFPQEVKRSKSMQKILNKGIFQFSFNRAFEQVLEHCAQIPRQDQAGTWLGPAMRQAYGQLHQLGYAQSVEVWQENQLVGGFYGVYLNDCFFGESMFARVSNASKAALLFLCDLAPRLQIQIIDCQVYTEHLESLGARFIRGKAFLERLAQGRRQAPKLWSELEINGTAG